MAKMILAKFRNGSRGSEPGLLGGESGILLCTELTYMCMYTIIISVRC